jgi:hypothetical protein
MSIRIHKIGHMGFLLVASLYQGHLSYPALSVIRHMRAQWVWESRPSTCGFTTKQSSDKSWPAHLRWTPAFGYVSIVPTQRRIYVCVDRKMYNA